MKMPSRSSAIATLALALATPSFAQQPVAKKQAQKTEERAGYTLAFVEADVRRVIDAVLGAMLGADYSVDPGVQGNVTLRTNRPVTSEQLVPLLENALSSVDAVIIVQGGRYKVLPRQAARTQASVRSANQSTDTGLGAPGFASEAITISKGNTREIARLLEQFVGKEVVSSVDAARNQIVITGSADERKAARDIIVRFDVDTFAEMNFEFYRLENVDAGTLMNELNRIFAAPYDIIGSRIRLIPLPRLRSILAVAGDRNDFAKIEPWIRRLDAGGSGKRKLYSYAVQNGRARDIARSLQQVLGSGGGFQEADSGTSNQPSENGESGSGGSASGITPPERSGEGAGQSSGGSTSVGLGAGAGGSDSSPRIVPNEEQNSLLIYANGEDYEFIREALQKLDQPVAQVLIEATLAEVTLTNDLRYGVDWAIASGRSDFIQSTNGSGVPARSFPGFSYSYLGNSVSAVLNTLQSKTNVKVLSAPKLMVLNNQSATLQVGDQVPIVTQQAQGVASPGAPIVNTIELRDTGVILKVTPRVNESGLVTLDIQQEVSDVAETTSSGINSPTIQQRRLSSTVSTRSGQMIALGGLIRDRVSKGKSGIPFLSQIPLIGGAFGRQSNTGSRTELIILITPTVIRAPEEVRTTVDALIEGLDQAKPMVRRAQEKQVGGKPPRP